MSLEMVAKCLEYAVETTVNFPEDITDSMGTDQ